MTLIRSGATATILMIACKVDNNQREIVKKLRKIPGVTVSITSALGDGFPDIVVGYKGVNHLIEIKDGSKPPSRRKLTPAEERELELKDEIEIEKR